VIVADVESFPISKDMSGALVKLHPGGMRQLHWHTNLDEWQFVINGTIQVRSLHHCCTLLCLTSGVLVNGSTLTRVQKLAGSLYAAVMAYLLGQAQAHDHQQKRCPALHIRADPAA